MIAPSGFINIVTAYAGKFGATVKTSTFIDNEAMQAHIEAEHDMGREVYWQPNECDDRDYPGARPTKDDVTSIRVLHLDLDFKDYFGKNRDYTPADVDELFARLQRGQGLGPNGEDVPPTAIVASGGGFHVYWVLAEPLPKTDATTTRVESINANIAKVYRAGKGTQDISRLLRVAYTTNFKPERNRAKVLNCVLNDNRYTLDDFAEARDLPLDKKKTEHKHEVGEALPVTDLSKLGLRFPQDHDTIALIVWSPPHHDPDSRWGEHQGRGFEQPPCLHYYDAEYLFDEGERSERVLSVVSRLAKRKVPVEMICGVLLNPAFGVSAHVLDQKDPTYYAKRQCRHLEQPVITGKLISLAPVPKDIPVPAIYVPGWLYERKVSILGGRGGVGKSALALTLAVSCALGKPLLTFRPKEPRRVLILNSEDDTSMMQLRLWSICKEYGLDESELEGKIYSLPLETVELIAKVETPDGIKFEQTPLYNQVLEYCDQYEIDALIVDPFGESFDNCDENSNSDMLKVIVAHRRALAQQKRDLSLLICHHSRKGYSQDGSEQDAFRGAGAIINAARFGQLLEPLTKEDAKSAVGDQGDRIFVKLTDAKRNYIKKAADAIFELKEHIHENGFPVVVFTMPDLTVIDRGLDIDVWPGLEQTLAEVRRRYDTRPFRPGGRGDRGTRLDAWIQDTFKLNDESTKLIVEKLFKESKVLSVAKWKDPSDRKLKDVVVVTGDELPEAIAEIPF